MLEFDECVSVCAQKKKPKYQESATARHLKSATICGTCRGDLFCSCSTRYSCCCCCCWLTLWSTPYTCSDPSAISCPPRRKKKVATTTTATRFGHLFMLDLTSFCGKWKCVRRVQSGFFRCPQREMFMFSTAATTATTRVVYNNYNKREHNISASFSFFWLFFGSMLRRDVKNVISMRSRCCCCRHI